MTTKTVSYSRLSTFLECPELYRLRYLEKPAGYPQPLQEPLIKGSLAHSCIEEYLKGHDKQTAIETALANWVVNVCNLPLGSSNYCAQEEECEEQVSIYDTWEENAAGDIDYIDEEAIGIDLDLLTDYALICGHLLYRSSAGYTKEDKIRKKDGTVPKNPLDYPPTPFKMEYNRLKLHEKRLTLDNQAVRCNLSFKRMSFANIAAWGAAYVFGFEVPDVVSNVDAIEYPLSKKQIYFGPKKDRYWNGFIDTIYSTPDGAKVINDHKTESAKRRPEDVAFDLQLNSYAAVVYEQTGDMPDYISITHLASNSLIHSHTYAEVMAQSMEYLEQIQSEIDSMEERYGEKNSWFKKWPSKYGSPCLQRRDDVITRACPYIRRCWPQYAECINDELIEYLGE